MKKIILSFICLCWFSLACSQHIHYQKTLSAALAEAAQSGKMVLVVIPPSTLGGYKDMPSALNSPAVAGFFNTHLISYKYDANDTAAVSLLKTYPINVFPAHLFVDSNKNLIYKQLGASLMPKIYEDMYQKAINLYSSVKTLTNYNARYTKGDRTIYFLKDYISLREELGLTDNSQLIEEYTGLLTATALQHYQEVLFILKAGPLLWGDAYKLCYDNKKIIDSIYKRETPATTSFINNTMVANTLKQAADTKNISVTEGIASDQQSKWVNDPTKGRMVYLKIIMNYYKAIKDTTKFYPLASWFYDTYYMKISADSAKKILSKQVNPLLDYAKKSRMDTEKIKIVAREKQGTIHSVNIPASTNEISIIVRPVSPPLPGNVAEELNNAAYDFYAIGTHNSTYLAKAMLWSKRSIELDPTYYSYDTLAHILYRLGFFAEAQYTQNKAITLAKAKKLAPEELANLKLELTKIKSRQL